MTGFIFAKPQVVLDFSKSVWRILSIYKDFLALGVICYLDIGKRRKVAISSTFNNSTITPLHCAAINGNLEKCKLILNNVDDINSKCEDGNTPFHWATMNGHLDVCRLFIERNNDKNPCNNDGVTPLHMAAQNGYLDACR